MSRTAGRRPWADPATVAAAAVLALVVVPVVTAPWLAPAGYDAQDVAGRLTAPTWWGAHPLGTDDLGRDVLVRALYGGRPALAISLASAAVSTATGLALALAAVLGGPRLDELLGRAADVQLAIPSILLALLVLAFGGPGIVPLLVVLAIGAWVLTFRIVRAQASRVVALPYIEAARLAGAGPASLLRRHVLPACAPLVIVGFTLNFSSIVVLESSLGYLGLGVQPPHPDWGQMVATGQAQLGGAWWTSIVPGAFIVATVVALQVLGDRLADHYSLSDLRSR